MGMSKELYPGVALVHFKDAYSLHQAAAATLRLESEQSSLPLPEAQVAQRRAILQLDFKLLVERRNKALDEFARMWLSTRQLPIPQPTEAAVDP